MYNTYTIGASYALFQPYLQDGEELLWTGKPYTSVPFRPHLGTLLFSMMWLGFALFWTVGASVAGGAFGLFGLPFICVGCGLLYAQTLGAAKQMKKTYYAVTDRRAIILTENRLGLHCTEFSFLGMANVSLLSVRGEVGSILFPRPVYQMETYTTSRRGVSVQGMQNLSGHGFLMIDNVQMVYRLISERISEENRR